MTMEDWRIRKKFNIHRRLSWYQLCMLVYSLAKTNHSTGHRFAFVCWIVYQRKHSLILMLHEYIITSGSCWIPSRSSECAANNDMTIVIVVKQQGNMHWRLACFGISKCGLLKRTRPTAVYNFIRRTLQCRPTYWKSMHRICHHFERFQNAIKVNFTLDFGSRT